MKERLRAFGVSPDTTLLYKPQSPIGLFLKTARNFLTHLCLLEQASSSRRKPFTLALPFSCSLLLSQCHRQKAQEHLSGDWLRHTFLTAVKMLLRNTHLISQCLDPCWGFASKFQFPVNASSGRWRSVVPVLGPCPRHGRSALSFTFLPLP